MDDTLQMLVNVPVTIVLAGKEYKVAQPSIQDLAEAEAYGKETKKEKRKAYLKEYLDLLTTLPKDMSADEKERVITTILPKDLTPQDKLKLLISMPSDWTEDQKQKQITRIVLEKEGVEWSETLFLLWKVLSKQQKDITLDQVKNMVTSNDIVMILDILNPKAKSGTAKN